MRRDQEGRGGSGLLAASFAVVMALGASTAPSVLGEQKATPPPPKVTAPQPTVPEVFTLMGQFVRVAYNNQGFVTMGYHIAQDSIGEEWMMLEVGLTTRAPAKDVKLQREDLKVKTPDGTILALATQKQYAEAGYLPAIDMKAKVISDSINYFPADVSRGCAINFYANATGPGRLAFDEVELSSNRGCVGRLYFHVPGGIKVGQHWLNVNFGGSEVQVPFRILTKEEAKQFKKSWEDIKKEHDASYKK